MEESDVIMGLAALAHAVRLQVFRALVVAGPAGLTPGVMQEGLGIAAATLSFHLKELLRSGLVSVERESRFLIYRAEIARINQMVGYLTENCCAGMACVPQPAPACGC